MTSVHRTPSWETQEETSSLAEATLSPRMQKNKHQVNSREILTPNLHTRIHIDAPGVVILLIERDSNAQQKCSNASHATGLVTIQAYVTKEASKSMFPSKIGKLRHTNYRQVDCMCMIVLFAANLKIAVQKILSTFNLRYSTTKQVLRTFLLLLI